jgi:hypothetical protein
MYGQPWSMYAPQTYVPQTYPGVSGGQLAPQGFLGNLLGQLAGPAGQAFGGLLGQPQIGSQIGQALGGLSHLLPFQTLPMPIQAGFQSGIVPPYLGSHLPFQPVQPVPGVAPMVA